MTTQHKEYIEKIQKAIISAEASLSAAKKWTDYLSNPDGTTELTTNTDINTPITDIEHEETDKIIEGIFDGKDMIGSDEIIYPVPANYASKSKLVEGDGLKMTLTMSGRLLFKQISKISRKVIMGKLLLDGSQYKVLSESKEYSVLYASITFFKGHVGDDVVITVPLNENAIWGAVENIINAV